MLHEFMFLAPDGQELEVVAHSPRYETVAVEDGRELQVCTEVPYGQVLRFTDAAGARILDVYSADPWRTLLGWAPEQPPVWPAVRWVPPKPEATAYARMMGAA